VDGVAGCGRQVRPGVWEMRVYTGRDPLTGKKTQASRHVRATARRPSSPLGDTRVVVTLPTS
jgi:hypothetical protein